MRKNIDEIADALIKISNGELSKDEAARLLRGITSVELSLAEQRLLERGIRPEELRGLCAVHLEVLDEQVSELEGELEPGHPLHTFLKEHDLILGFLEEMERATQLVMSRTVYSESDFQLRAELDRMRDLAYHLVETEKHHAREEQVLFPEMERRGITGPPRIMRLEHEDLRPRKKQLKRLVDELRPESFAGFKNEIKEIVPYLVYTLREHISKENTILYPGAHEAIPEKEVWDRMKAECDQIGYCCFTPLA